MPNTKPNKALAKKSIAQILNYLTTAVDPNTIRIMALTDLQQYAGRKCGSAFMNALVAASTKDRSSTVSLTKISKGIYTVLNATAITRVPFVAFPDEALADDSSDTLVDDDPISAGATVSDFMDVERRDFPNAAVKPVSVSVTPLNVDTKDLAL